MNPFVTVSAPFGAGGSEIGPALARRLGVPFFDRAIPAAVAERLGASVDDPVLSEGRPLPFLGATAGKLRLDGLLIWNS